MFGILVLDTIFLPVIMHIPEVCFAIHDFSSSQEQINLGFIKSLEVRHQWSLLHHSQNKLLESVIKKKKKILKILGRREKAGRATKYFLN